MVPILVPVENSAQCLCGSDTRIKLTKISCSKTDLNCVVLRTAAAENWYRFWYRSFHPVFIRGDFCEKTIAEFHRDLFLHAVRSEMLMKEQHIERTATLRKKLQCPVSLAGTA
jgi:hypothetical protein